MNPPFNLQRNRSRLSGYEVKDADYSGLDLRNAVAQGSKWIRCTFTRVRFDGAALGDATFQNCSFRECSFERAVLVSRLYLSTFDRCSFDQATFTGADVAGSTFRKCRAQYSDWTRSTVTDTQLDVDFRGATLNFALTRNVDFTGSNLWSALIPFNCAMIYGNKFDERTFGALLSLCGYASGPRELLDKAVSLVSQHTRRMVEKIVKYETGEAES